MPDTGSVCLEEEITSMSRAELARFRLQNIGFIFQNFNLFPALTAAENIELVLNVRDAGSAKSSASLAGTSWVRTSSESKPGDLSGGQKQRVAIVLLASNRG